MNMYKVTVKVHDDYDAPPSMESQNGDSFLISNAGDLVFIKNGIPNVAYANDVWLKVEIG